LNKSRAGTSRMLYYQINFIPLFDFKNASLILVSKDKSIG